MKVKKLITKIAFFVSLAALIFSVITLIRNAVLGMMVFLSVIQVLGSAAIAVICGYLIYSLRGLDDEEEDEAEPAENAYAENMYNDASSDDARADAETVFEFYEETAYDESPDFSEGGAAPSAFENESGASAYDFSLFEEK